jgi:hypothetical protein
MLILTLLIALTTKLTSGLAVESPPSMDTLPVICLDRGRTTLPQTARIEFSPQRDSVFNDVRHRVESYEGFIGPPFFHAPPMMDDLWQRDSTGVRFELARIIGDEAGESHNDAEVASIIYSRLSSTPDMVFEVSGMIGTPQRTFLALRAIRGPLSEAQERQVLDAACRAGWLLLALHASPIPFDRGPDPWWYPLTGIMIESFRLMGSRHRIDLRSLMWSTMKPPPDFGWLETRYPAPR